MISLKDFKVLYRTIDDFVTKEAETFKFRFLMQSLYDDKFRNDLEYYLKLIHSQDSAKKIEQYFVELRKLCINELKLAKNELDEEKKMDYMLSGLAYFCLLESFNENSKFSIEIEKMIMNDFGDNYLDVLKLLDRVHLSKDVKKINLDIEQDSGNQNDKLNSETARKYLVMKKWQDEQRSFSLKNIRPLYSNEKEYIGEDVQNLMDLHKRTLIKRARRKMLVDGFVSLDELTCYYIAGVDTELLQLIGGKAWGLVLLKSCGYNVPQTWVIPVGCDVDSLVFSKLSPQISYAVRSSASCEDGKEFSFAGMFDSYLNVCFDDLKIKITQVLSSLENERVAKYIELKNIKEIPQMAIVVQEYIAPDKAGVWLGTQVEGGILEWCEGSGEKLVSGRISPQNEEWKENKRVKGNGKFDLLAKKILYFQKSQHQAADIEWCIQQGNIYFLQYRAVTVPIISHFREEIPNERELIIKGIPAAGGIVKGNSAFLGKNHMNSVWNEGDILLAWFTDPDWLDILQKSSGLVTAVGGMLCHAAIIARELGIPCVTGIGGEYMKKIWNGGEIEVDGYSGLVRILEEK